jgi:signal transduction histidine kinase
VSAGSLRLRLLLGAMLWVLAALAVVAGILWQMFSAYAENEFYNELLNDQGQILAALTVDSSGLLAVSGPIHDQQFEIPYSGLYWQVDDGEAGFRIRSRSLWDFALKLPGQVADVGTQHRYRLNGPEHQSVLAVERIVQISGYVGPVRVVVASDARALDTAVRRFGWSLITSFVVLGIALIGAGTLQVWVGLRPLKGLRARLGLVREGGVRHLEGRFPSEIQPLVDDLNVLLDHQSEVVQRARMMVGNLAHGLKTPLAVIANEANRLDQAGAREAAALIQAQVTRMQRQVDYHMTRARAAAARAVPGVRCPLAPSVQSLLRVIERLHVGRALKVVTDISDSAVFRGERQDLEEMLGNLLDNAAKWAVRRVSVSCRISAPGWLEVFVDDDGPGLAPERRNEAFARGRRLDEAVPGSGLGLAIVRDLAEMYGGEARLDDSPLGGLRAVLRLPGAMTPTKAKAAE